MSKSANRRPSIREVQHALLTLNQVLSKKMGIPAARAIRANGSIDQQILLPAAKAAGYLGVSQKTLANWRCSGTRGLPYIQVGSRVLYRQIDLDDFILNSRKLSTSERDGGRHG